MVSARNRRAVRSPIEAAARVIVPAILVILCSVAGAAEEAKTQGGAAQKADRIVEITNPGFEQGTSGWSEEQFQRFKTLVEIDRQRGHRSNISLRINNRRGTENAFLSQTVEGITAGGVYAASVWVRGDGETMPSLPALRLSFLDAEGNELSSCGTRQQPSLDGQWHELAVQGLAEADAAGARIRLQLFGGGTAWFDDVKLVMAKPPPPVVLSPRRIAVKSGQAEAIEFSVRLREARSDDAQPQIRFTLAGVAADEAAPEVTMEQTDARTFAVSAALPALNAGRYQLQARPAGSETAADLSICVPVADRKPTGLTDDGVLLVNDKPFFPIGLCHVPPDDYEDIARHGFSCVQGIADPRVEVLANNVQMALDADLRLDVPLYAWCEVDRNLRASRQKVGRFSKHIAVMSWKIMDEPSVHFSEADEVPAAYNSLKEADPEHPFALAVARPDRYDFWANFCDLMQVPAYPLPDEPLTVIGERMQKAKQALEPWQHLTAVLQAGWQNDPMNQPTFGQARTMVYLALINGARGIFWYAYRDPGWRLSETPLWDRLRDINRETASLAGPLMRGTAAEGVTVQAENSAVQWLARAHGGKVYVLAVNPSEEPAPVTIDPGRAIAGAATVYGRAATVEEGNVTLDLKAVDANTAILQLQQEEAPEPTEEEAEGGAAETETEAAAAQEPGETGVEGTEAEGEGADTAVPDSAEEASTD